MIFNATVQTCIFDSNVDDDREREASGRRRLVNNETMPKIAVASDCDAAGLNETRQARRELVAPMNEVEKMKAAHSAEIAGLKDEIQEGREESRRAHELSQRAREESQRAQAETRELLLQLLTERIR